MAYFQLTVGGHVDCVFSEEERRSKNSFAILGSLLLRLICFLKHLFSETFTSGGGSLKRKKGPIQQKCSCSSDFCLDNSECYTYTTTQDRYQCITRLFTNIHQPLLHQSQYLLHHLNQYSHSSCHPRHGTFQCMAMSP